MTDDSTPAGARDRALASARLAVRVGRETVEIAQRTQATFLAAAVAYYAFVSLVPLLVVALAAASTVGGEAAVDRWLVRGEAVLTPATRELVTDALVGGTGQVGATALGTVVLLWSALKLFRGMDKAFSQVFGTVGSKGFVGEIRDGLVVAIAIPVGVTVVTLVGFALAVLPLGPAGGPIGTALVVATLVALFFPLYYVLPDRRLTARAALPGAVFAAVGWTVLAVGFRLYLEIAVAAALYGVLGGIFLLVTLLYAGALILILGAALNAALLAVAGIEPPVEP